MAADELAATAAALVAPGKGILAADESSGTIKKRFDSIEVPSTEDNRRAYRELLFTTEGAAEFISGVILYDETLRQRAADGTPLPEVLSGQGVIPGIKVDKGTTGLAGFEGEKITEGVHGGPGHLLDPGLGRAVAARQDHVRLEQHAVEPDPVAAQGLEGLGQGVAGDPVAALDRVVAVHQDLGLDDRDQPGLLGQGGEAAQGLGVGLDAGRAGDCLLYTSPSPRDSTSSRMPSSA